MMHKITSSSDTRQDKINESIAKVLVVSLSGLAITIFIGWKDVGPFKLFNLVSLAALLIWRYVIKYRPQYSLPREIYIISILFIVSMTVSALQSQDRHFAFVLLKQYKLIFLGGLLFTAPLGDRYRKPIVIIYFLAAAAAGLIGILQYFGLMHMASDRPYGFSENPNLYAGALSIVCSSTMVMLFLPKTYLFESRNGFFFMLGIVILTLCGIILSQSRSIWLALLAACVVTLFLYNRRKGLILLSIFFMIFTVLITCSNTLRQRAISIATSAFTEDVSGSTGTRIELWKGALLMFEEHPFFGIGLGDFQTAVNKLISENKLKSTIDTHHAHNIYLQALATRGIIGLAILMLFLISLFRWGQKSMENNDALGGYIIILITVLTMVGGLTDNHLDFSRFLTASCFTIGLLGPLGAVKNQKIHCSNEGKT
jgi:O-antigen ligase